MNLSSIEVLKKCGKLGSGTAEFSFKNDLYALDSTIIDLCLSLFPWARFRKEKGAIKLHTLFNVRSQIPELITITKGKVNDVPPAHEIDFSQFPKGSIFVFDHGYNDYSLLWKIKEAGHHYSKARFISSQLCLKSFYSKSLSSISFALTSKPSKMLSQWPPINSPSSEL